jgi:hypothetical protein
MHQATGFHVCLVLFRQGKKTSSNQQELGFVSLSSVPLPHGRNLFEAEAERITNTMLRRKFDNIRIVFEFVNARQLNWLGHLLHSPDSRQTKKPVNAWVAHPGKEEGQPQHLLRHSFRKALIAAGETNKDNKKAASDIHSLTLKEWRAQSKKGSRHGCWKRRDTKNDNAGCQKL